MNRDAGDVGNWLQSLGMASLIIEGVVAILAALILAGTYRASHASRPWVRASRRTGRAGRAATRARDATIA